MSFLAKSQRVADRLKAEFGPEQGKSALLMLRRAKLSGDLGNSVNDFLSGEIPDNAEEVVTRYGCSTESMTDEKAFFKALR